MLERKVLIFKLLAVDRFASSAISSSEVSSLNHESFDNAVEG